MTAPTGQRNLERHRSHLEDLPELPMPRDWEPLADRDGRLCGSEDAWRDWLERLDARVRRFDPVVRAFSEWRPAAAAGGRPGRLVVNYKDVIDVAGFSTRLGSTSGYRHHPDRSGFVAGRLARAGAICNGKAVTPEFQVGTRHPCVNPLFPDYSPAGSSTGSGVAVAAGFCDVSIGTDTAGSVRWPAAYCGCVGLRVTPRPELLQGVVSVAPSIETLGPIVRTAADLQYLWFDRGLGDAFCGGAAQQDSGPRPLRVGVVANYEDGPVDPEVRAAFLDFVDSLRRAGIDVLEKRLSWWRFRALTWELLVREHWDYHVDLRAKLPVEYDPGTWRTIEYGREIDDDGYAALKRDQEQAMRLAEADLAQGDVELLILPVDPALPRNVREVPPPPSSMAHKEPNANAVDPWRDPRFNPLASFPRLPALAFPVARSRSGAPIGVQLIARRGGEADLVRAGVVLEKIAGFWAGPRGGAQ